MDGSGPDQILASKWDIPFVLLGMIRVAFGDLPVWVKAIVIGLVGSLSVWATVTWFRERGRRTT